MYKIIVTTTRRPTPRTRSLVKDLVSVIPGAVRFTRGHYSMPELAIEARALGAERVLIVASRRGNPSLVRFYKVGDEELVNIASLSILGVTLSREWKKGTPQNIGTAKGVAVYLVRRDPTAEIVAEALVGGLGARVSAESNVPDYVVIVLSPSERGGVEAVFTFNGRVVGPKLRLSPVSKSLKGVNIEG
ncbi:MAG: hypothetical protein F7C35_01205 [Desulfurococcales archaeon]|nr:hypothetical protein [Desulfurococcales archaeon]